MADNVYGNGSNSTAGANTIVHYYDRAGIKAANRMNVYGQFSDRKSMPTKMGKTFKISKFLHMYDRALSDGDFAAKGYLTARNAADVSAALSNATLAEGAGAVNKQTLSKITVESTLARYGEMLDYTDEVELFSEDAMQVRYREELGELANSRFEDLIQMDMLGTGTVIRSGTATALTEVDTKVSYDLVRKGVRKLVRNRAKKNTSIVTGSTKVGTTPIAKAFYSVIGADVKSDLENLTRGSNAETEYVYQPAHKYAGAASLAEGEVGAMHEVRFIEAESAVVYRGAGAGYAPTATSGDVYTTDATLQTTTFASTAATEAARGSILMLNTGVLTTALAATSLGAELAQFEVVEVATAAIAAEITAADADVVAVLIYADVFPMLFPTEGAFATVGLKGKGKIKFNSKSPAQVENSNPYGTTGFFSYNFFYAGLILEEEKLMKILVSASV